VTGYVHTYDGNIMMMILMIKMMMTMVQVQDFFTYMSAGSTAMLNHVWQDILIILMAMMMMIMP